MRTAEGAGNDVCPVKIKYIAAPLYVLATQTLDKVGSSLFPIILLKFGEKIRHNHGVQVGQDFCTYSFHDLSHIVVDSVLWPWMSASKVVQTVHFLKYQHQMVYLPNLENDKCIG